MKFSKNWLQEYIVERLPRDEEIVVALNKKAFEVEETFVITRTQTTQTKADLADNATQTTQTKADLADNADTVFDIKVLPNRAHDALGHHGMAYELCATLGLTFNKEKEVHEDLSYYDSTIVAPMVTIEDPLRTTRFMSLRIDGVTVGESPTWLKERLEAIGQRSINNIVDVTNYVQFALNKPMHAYDARSIKGTLSARNAREGETLMTLDDKELTLTEGTLVIADDEKVLGLAGIKGGKWSGIKDDTTSIILESANFEPTLIRKTAERYGYKTDASKRFENGIANGLVIEGLHMTANLIHTLCPSAHKSQVVDVYPKKDTPYFVGISLSELNDILGSKYDDARVRLTLEQLSFPYEVIVPEEYIRSTYPTLLGAAYKNPSSMREDAPHAFSCSSLISYLYKGVWMPSLSIDKYVFSKKITKEELRFGDIIVSNTGEGKIRYESEQFLRGTRVDAGLDHIALYIGDNKVVHATKSKGMVVEESLDEHFATRTFVGCGRLVEDLREPRYVVRIPSVRLDLRIKEDLAEEIGRIIGYDQLTPVLPTLSREGVLHKRVVYENKVRSILLAKGFSEVITYSFGDTGEVALVKGLAEDKEKLRASLSVGMLDAFARNLYNAPLLGQKTIALFEFGNVFYDGKEVKHLSIALDDGGKKSMFTEDMEMILGEIKRTLQVPVLEYETKSTKPYVIEIDFDTLLTSCEEPTSYEAPSFQTTTATLYKAVSPYPFIVRDIAVWTPFGTTWENIHTLALQIDDPRIVRIDCFDTFTKTFDDGTKKTSYAFRFVIQSYEKTLTDEEANVIADKMYTLLKEKGYEVR